MNSSNLIALTCSPACNQLTVYRPRCRRTPAKAEGRGGDTPQLQELGEVEQRLSDARCRRRRALSATSLVLLSATPGLAHAEGFVSVEVVRGLLEQIQELGAAAPVIFTAGVAGAEMIPLFPTALTMIASGLLFGSLEGATCMVLGTCLAATLAFYLSRTVGRGLAESIIKEEMGDGASSGTGVVARQLAKVQDAIANGTLVQQTGAILVLRLLPVVPFSASNYFLGLTPLAFLPFIAGTALGELFWALLYGSLGGASRGLLKQGVRLEVLLNGEGPLYVGVALLCLLKELGSPVRTKSEDLQEQASSYTVLSAQVGLVLGVVTLAGWALSQARKRSAADATGGRDSVSLPGSSESGSKQRGEEELPLPKGRR